MKLLNANTVINIFTFRVNLQGMPFPKLLLILFLLPLYGVAQDRCSTVEYEVIRRNRNPKHENTKDFEKWLSDKIQLRKLNTNSTKRTEDVTYTVPVVFHIIHTGEPIGTGVNISDAQILSQINVLNKDYQRLNADAASTPTEFQSVAGNLSIQFVLAKQDPGGQPTNGIVRVKGSQNSWTISEDVSLKSQSYWPSENYLNIWVCDIGGGLVGYASFPQSNLLVVEDSNTNRLTDGAVLDYKAVGSVDDGNFNLDSRFNLGRTATHEIGHFFGLKHIWGDDSGACTGTDYVEDTPNQAGSTSGCPSHPRISCNVTNMFQNFLDYANDGCMNLFTKGQVDRMTVILNNSPRRVSLLTSPGAKIPSGGSNIVDIGISNVNNPMPVSCVITPVPSITVKNNGTSMIYNFKVLVTTNNGVVQTQSISSVGISPGTEVVYNLSQVNLQAGTNTIKFELTEPNGSADDNVQDNIVSLRTVVNTTKDIIPLRQNFETTFQPAWSIVTQGQAESWKATPTNKGQSLIYSAFANGNLNSESWFASPVLDLSKLEEASVFFDVSYGRKDFANDGLKILASADCGATYSSIPIYEKQGAELATGSSSTSWLPSLSSDWRREYVNLTAYTGNNNVRLAFIATNANGNNIVIDNVEFFADNNPTPISISDSYTIYQGPADFSLTFNLSERQDVRMQIYNLTGQLVIDNLMYDVLNQTYSVDFNPQSSGIYLVRMQIGPQLSTTKVFVSR